jgi:uncharacterized protein (DUF924 family)
MTLDRRAGLRELLEFWFGVPGTPEWNSERAVWFTKSVAFDDALRSRFLPLWLDAHDSDDDGHGDWSDDPEALCARIVLLDQLPRNMFRNDSRSFATDVRALALAERVVASGADRAMPTPYHRMFCYMPFEHAESPHAQAEAVRLMTLLRDETGGRVDAVRWAVWHQRIIERFGRFPHRNAALGRPSTAAEQTFLAQPNSSF